MFLIICYHLDVLAPISQPGLASSPNAPPPRTFAQARLFCPCGSFQLFCGGLCSRCYWRDLHSRQRFAGYRDQVLRRDRHRCRACGALEKLAVHHRRPGVHHPRLLVTLCAACHVRIHRLAALRYWLEPALVPLWQEQHPRVPLQLQFAWEPA